MAAPRFAESVSRNNHPPWRPPQNDSAASLPALRVNNSLTEDKEPFVPVSGRRVTWYTCGPTVYDSCHMGHARAYLTFDILRRIMEDYFHFDVLYQVNVTDIDDKIIIRARRNKLISDYREGHQSADSLAEVARDVEAALAKADASLQKAAAKLAEPLAVNTAAAQEEHKKLVEEHKLKVEQFNELRAIVTAVQASGNPDAVITAAKDPLGAYLDDLKGASITDHSIFEAHARRYEREFREDMEALGVREADVITRVTEYVPKIVDFIGGIIAKGMAYESNGSVYFDTAAYKRQGHHYPKLKPGGGGASEAEMQESEGGLASDGKEKRNANDFALWKKSKPGEPSWPSPWGPGRPGWHIECSVMAGNVFGGNMDIHAGGSDLKFPHHDNELAQSESFFGCDQWVNYFLHAGHLHIKGLKMSKSLKNFITIRDALTTHTARQLRLIFLLQPWDKPMNYSDQTVSDAKAKETTFKSFFGEVKALLRKDWQAERQDWTEAELQLENSLAQTQSRVHSALLDNFNTPEAIQALCDIISDANKYLRSPAPRVPLLRKIAQYVTQILRIFGVVEGNSEIGFPTSAEGADPEKLLQPYLDALVDFREAVRDVGRRGNPELVAQCDKLRDDVLPELGVRLEDPAVGKAVWKLDDPATLKREVEEKRERLREKERGKIRNELEKLTKASLPPQQLFRIGEHAGKYAEYDEQGIPTKTANGEDVNKKTRTYLEKEFGKQLKIHEDFLQKDGANLITNLQGQLAALT
eukprot:TRINITY_DN12801_c0_g1_i1.p2 TRINITY_DN12801_c0_g1~~TRINITY_DN12801_c0_g1_i1.p2  ORF type:complete len:756 (-),score=189.59 TRINITY_DN12801_c0_g1_i1:168-2435(-)